MRTLETTDHNKILLDDEDYQTLKNYKIYLGKEKYPYIIKYIGKLKKRIPIHLLVHPSPKGMYTDHKDGDKLNCTRENLVSVHPYQNARNRLKHKGKTKYKGVVKVGKRYRTTITYFHKQMQVGYFNDELTAAIAFDVAAEALDPEHFKRNFDPPHDMMPNVRKQLSERIIELKKEASRLDKKRPKERSKYRGVSRNGAKWQAQISVNGERRHIATRDTEEEAAREYDRVCIEIGRTSMLNFPDEYRS